MDQRGSGMGAEYDEKYIIQNSLGLMRNWDYISGPNNIYFCKKMHL